MIVVWRGLLVVYSLFDSSRINVIFMLKTTGKKLKTQGNDGKHREFYLDQSVATLNKKLTYFYPTVTSVCLYSTKT